MQREMPAAKYSSRVAISRIPPPSSTLRPLSLATALKISVLVFTPVLAPSKSTIWIHSAPACRKACAVARGSSATRWAVAKSPFTSRTHWRFCMSIAGKISIVVTSPFSQ